MIPGYTTGVEDFAKRNGLVLVSCDSSGLYDSMSRKVSATFKVAGKTDHTTSEYVEAFYRAVADMETICGRKFSLLSCELVTPLQVTYTGQELPHKLSDLYEANFHIF